MHSLLGHWFPWLHLPSRRSLRQPNQTLQICKLQIIYLQRYDFLLSSPCMVRYFHQTSPTSNSENHQHHSTGTAHHRHNIVHRWVPYMRFVRFWSWCWFIALWWMPPPTGWCCCCLKISERALGIFRQLQHQWLARDILHPSQGVCFCLSNRFRISPVTLSPHLKKSFLKISYISYTAPWNLQY